jgi:hypothetical protein
MINMKEVVTAATWLTEVFADAATAETAYANVVGSKWFYCEQYQKEYL